MTRDVKFFNYPKEKPFLLNFFGSRIKNNYIPVLIKNYSTTCKLFCFGGIGFEPGPLAPILRSIGRTDRLPSWTSALVHYARAKPWPPLQH